MNHDCTLSSFSPAGQHVLDLTSTKVYIKGSLLQGDFNITDFPSELLVREGDEIICHFHYQSLVVLSYDNKFVKAFRCASITDSEPVIAIAPQSKVLLIGAYQTVYGISVSSGDLMFSLPLAFCGGVKSLSVLSRDSREACIIVSEIIVQMIDMTGVLLWRSEFDDPVELINIVDSDLIVRILDCSLTKMARMAKISLSNGNITFL